MHYITVDQVGTSSGLHAKPRIRSISIYLVLYDIPERTFDRGQPTLFNADLTLVDTCHACVRLGSREHNHVGMYKYVGLLLHSGDRGLGGGRRPE